MQTFSLDVRNFLCIIPIEKQKKGGKEGKNRQEHLILNKR